MEPVTGWYPVALADGIGPGTSAGTRLFGRELVVWRDEAGNAHVWEDRCPHRGMRLSFGFVRGDRLACLYHGWQFDAVARCRTIPAHPDLKVPGTIRATACASAERLGMVWTFAGPADPTEEPPGGEAATTPVRSLALQVAAGPAFAALLAVAAASPFASGATVRAERSGPLVVLQAGEERLIAAVQPLSGTESAVHLAIAGAPGTYRGAGQARASAWAEALRRAAEATP